MASSTRSISGRKTARRRSFMAQPFMSPSGVYQFRRKVPLELRAVLGHEYKRSLKTRDPAEAKAKHAEEWSRSDVKFTLARAQLAGGDLLGARDVQLLAARWHRAELDKLEMTGDFASWLTQGPTVTVEHGDYYDEHSSLLTMREALGHDPDADFTEEIEAYVKTTLRESNIPLPAPGTETYVRLVSAFRANALDLSDIAMKRYEGDWQTQANVLPEEPLGLEAKRTVRKQETKKLLALFEEYAQDKVLNDGDTRGVRKTIAGYRAVVVQFIELCGDTSVAQISRETIRQYRAFMAALPSKGEGIRKLTARQLIAKAEAEGLPKVSEATVRNKLRTLSAVLSYAVRMGLATENPVIAGGIAKAAARAATNRSASTRRRKEYSNDELKLIFASPIYTDASWSSPRADFGKAWYWMPLLMYYTGARREELAQLAVRDVRQTEDGIWHLSILAVADDEDAGRGVKTAGSRRFIPLHPDLLALSFLEYVEGLSPTGQLFPLLKPSPDGYYGTNFGKRWAHYLRETVGLKSSASPSHGFRHSFKTICREVGIPEDVHDAITGHSGNGAVARDYGTMPLSRMAQEMMRYRTAPLAGNVRGRPSD